MSRMKVSKKHFPSKPENFCFGNVLFILFDHFHGRFIPEKGLSYGTTMEQTISTSGSWSVFRPPRAERTQVGTPCGTVFIRCSSPSKIFRGWSHPHAIICVPATWSAHDLHKISLSDSYQELPALLDKRRKLQPWSGLLIHKAYLFTCQHRRGQQEDMFTVFCKTQSSPTCKFSLPEDCSKRIVLHGVSSLIISHAHVQRHRCPIPSGTFQWFSTNRSQQHAETQLFTLEGIRHRTVCISVGDRRLS